MTDTAKAIDSFHRDAMFRTLAHSCVAEAMEGINSLDEYVKADVHDVALKASILLLERVFTDDAALNMMRTERDHYRELAERCLISMPPPQIVLKPLPAEPQ